MKNKLLLAGVAIIALPFLQACGNGEAKADTQKAQVAALPVTMAKARIGNVAAHYHATANLEAEAEATVTARVGGEVTRILVEEGQFVKAGTVLAVLDGERLRLDARKARAELAKLQQDYQRQVELHEKGLVAAVSFDQLKFSMQSLEAAYELAQLQYSYTNITAPISGVVSQRHVKVGQALMPGQQAFEITDVSSLVASLDVPQKEMAKFVQGQTAQLTFDALPGVHQAAKIDLISPTVDSGTGTFRMKLAVDRGNPEIAAGMFARVRIAYEYRDNVLLIPSSAVITEDERSVVYVIQDGIAQRREIQTGISDSGMTQIVSGLGQDETVVAAGVSALRDGSQVIASTDTSYNAG